MGGNDGEIYKTTTACADETGIEIVKVREKDVEGRCYQEAYMHAFLWCSKIFAPELLLVGESEHNIYICMKRMEIFVDQFRSRLCVTGSPQGK